MLAALVVIPIVHADSYVIPLEGARWKSSAIAVHIYGGASWQQNQTYQAMQIWNQAQLWFTREYFQNSPVYVFTVGDSSAPVQVNLLNASTIVGSIQAWTEYHAQNGFMESASVKIAARYSRNALLILSVHELGHVLGLSHVSCCEKDLMNAYPVANSASPFPTTLDLYAVHILASSDLVPSQVSLLRTIPYGTAPTSEVGLPEFPDLLIVLIGMSCLMIIRRHE